MAWLKFALMVAGLLCLRSLSQVKQETVKIERDIVDLGIEFQTIEHFGASDCWTIEPIGKFWAEESKQQLTDLLFSLDKGIGLSCWRFNIGAGHDETIRIPYRSIDSFAVSEGIYDWNRCEGQRWFL